MNPGPQGEPLKHPSLRCIVSGGQTGVDRAALDVAIELGFQHGGWCPKGRMAEDGRISGLYRLRETDDPNYSERTRRNAADADATLILLLGELQGGTLLTWRICQKLEKPVLIVRLHRPGPDQRVIDWISSHGVETLNVAGPRASKQPKVYQASRTYLTRVLTPLRPPIS